MYLCISICQSDSIPLVACPNCSQGCGNNIREGNEECDNTTDIHCNGCICNAVAGYYPANGNGSTCVFGKYIYPSIYLLALLLNLPPFSLMFIVGQYFHCINDVDCGGGVSTETSRGICVNGRCSCKSGYGGISCTSK